MLIKGYAMEDPLGAWVSRSKGNLKKKFAAYFWYDIYIDISMWFCFFFFFLSKWTPGKLGKQTNNFVLFFFFFLELKVYVEFMVIFLLY